MVPADADDIPEAYRILLGELEQYNPELLGKDRVLAISKCDLLDAELRQEVSATLHCEPVLRVTVTQLKPGQSTEKSSRQEHHRVWASNYPTWNQ